MTTSLDGRATTWPSSWPPNTPVIGVCSSGLRLWSYHPRHVPWSPPSGGASSCDAKDLSHNMMLPPAADMWILTVLFTSAPPLSSHLPQWMTHTWPMISFPPDHCFVVWRSINLPLPHQSSISLTLTLTSIPTSLQHLPWQLTSPHQFWIASRASAGNLECLASTIAIFSDAFWPLTGLSWTVVQPCASLTPLPSLLMPSTFLLSHSLLGEMALRIVLTTSVLNVACYPLQWWMAPSITNNVIIAKILRKQSSPRRPSSMPAIPLSLGTRQDISRGSGPKSAIFWMVSKSFLSVLIYSNRCEYDILKVLLKKID